MTAIPRLAIEGEYAYYYLLHQITRKAELREIVQYLKKKTTWGKDINKAGLSKMTVEFFYCISKILFIAKTFAELTKYS